MVSKPRRRLEPSAAVLTRAVGHNCCGAAKSPAVEAAAQHRLQRTRFSGVLLVGPRARRGLRLKYRRRSYRAAEPGSLGVSSLVKSYRSIVSKSRAALLAKRRRIVVPYCYCIRKTH